MFVTQHKENLLMTTKKKKKTYPTDVKTTQKNPVQDTMK